MSQRNFDVVVLGAGPGGYVAAIRAAQDGKLKVALVEADFAGGTCLNRGCIPTKALIGSAHALDKVKHAKDFGIDVSSFSINFAQMAKRKDSVVSGIRKGLEGLIAANQITVIKGKGSFLSKTEMKIAGDAPETITFKHAIIATGSKPLSIRAFECDHKRILDSTSILALTELPKSLIVVGGGYIGCEFASLYAELGVKVTILEALPKIIQNVGDTASEVLTKAFSKAAIDIKCGVRVLSIEHTKTGVKATIEDIATKATQTVESELALVSVGRKLCTEEIGLEKLGLATSPQGAISVNAQMQTAVPNIYAIGDVTAKSMLAHVASHQGCVAADHILGRHVKMHYEAIPAVVFTKPEIASVGLTLEAALKAGHKAVEGKFPFSALGKSQASGETEGFSQVIIEEKTGQILGALVIGHEASILIAEMALAMHNELCIDEVTATVHAHPTAAEGWLEAGLLATGMPLHYPPVKRKKA